MLENLSFSDHRSYVGGVHTLVMVVDDKLDVERLTSLIKTRLINLKYSAPNTHDRKYFPRFTQCLVRSAGGSLVWADDPWFVLSRHVASYTGQVQTQAELESLLRSKTREGLPVDSPLWHLLIAKGRRITLLAILASVFALLI